ncbi:hypothetical protein ACIOJE_35030 [Kitasatospora sp. NPDC087861]|uniref:hypothetical protein n=1 Tax=Kitasatospora sp. NPDC087861 TaxID=3364070 RepID=UPI00381A9FD8
MKDLVMVPAERGGPGKSVQTAGPLPWSRRTWLIMAVLFVLGTVCGITVLRYGPLHLTGWLMWAAGTVWVASVVSALTADRWLHWTAARRVVLLDVDGGTETLR